MVELMVDGRDPNPERQKMHVILLYLCLAEKIKTERGLNLIREILSHQKRRKSKGNFLCLGTDFVILQKLIRKLSGNHIEIVTGCGHSLAAKNPPLLLQDIFQGS